jgi:hypothetical protein
VDVGYEQEVLGIIRRVYSHETRQAVYKTTQPNNYSLPWELFTKPLPSNDKWIRFSAVHVLSREAFHSMRLPLWSSGQSSWLHNGDVLCFL